MEKRRQRERSNLKKQKTPIKETKEKQKTTEKREKTNQQTTDSSLFVVRSLCQFMTGQRVRTILPPSTRKQPHIQSAIGCNRTQEAADMRILRDSIDTENSFSETRSTPRHFDAHRCTLAKLSTAIGCNKDARSSLQMYIARFFQYRRLVFQRNSRFQDTWRCTDVLYHFSEGNRL